MDALPAHRIRAIHIAGGTEVEATSGERRLLDDHRHAVPDSVYALLERVGERVPHAIDVILERDGAFPSFDVLLGELDRARAALAAGRARRAAGLAASPAPGGPAIGPLREAGDARHTGLFEKARGQQARVEALLASLYVDRAARERWLADPDGEGRRAGLDEAARDAMRTLDRPGLELAAASFAHKRAAGGAEARLADRQRTYGRCHQNGGRLRASGAIWSRVDAS